MFFPKAEKKQDSSIRRFNKTFELLLPAWFFANPIVKSGQKLIAEISSLFLNFERKKKLFKKADAWISKYSTGQEIPIRTGRRTISRPRLNARSFKLNDPSL